MPRILDPALAAALPRLTRRTTLQIVFGDGTQMNLATSDIAFGALTFLGKLALPGGELNLDATEAADMVKMKITNARLTLGQSLINTVDIVSGTDAVLGCYFKNLQTGEEWHDVKLKGKITVGNITGEFIPITFEANTSAVIFNGQAVAELFPDSAIPTNQMPTAQAAPLPAINDLLNVQNSEVMGKLSPFLQDNQYGGRYYVPNFELRQYSETEQNLR